jgi:hypothetical protein
MKTTRATAVLLSAALALGAALPACGPSGPPPQATKREIAPAWQDVFDGTPELYAVIRPQALKRDAVYGSFFKTLMRVAQAKSEMTGVTALEAAEGCDEILVGVSKKEGQAEDAAIVFRGVPGALDPQRMTDAGGHPMFRLIDERAKVPELERIDRKNLAGGSLFVLPDRTWVIATGAARARARQAFAAPFGRPAPRVDADALASVRLDPDAFLRTPRFEKSSIMGPLLKKLSALTLALKPGKGGAVVKLQYEDEDATAWAELQTKRLIEDLAAANFQAPPERPPAAGPRRPTTPPPPPPEGGRRLAWLKDAKVTREGNAVTVQLPLPPRLLDELPMASGRDFPL